MIYSETKRMILSGIGRQTSALYIGSDGTPKNGCWGVADGQGDAQIPVYVFGCDDTPCGIIYAKSSLLSTAIYDLEGTALPVESTVYLSIVNGELSKNALESGVFAEVQSDADGGWYYERLSGVSGNLYAWIKIPANMPDMLNSDISITVTEWIPEEPGGYQIFADFTAIPELENDAGDFVLELAVSGPTDMNYIELYAHDPDTEEDVSIPLDGNISGSNGNWIISTGFWKDGTPFTSFRLSGRTDDAEGVIRVTVSTYKTTCLSGDTLITLADGAVKRLDHLTINDLVMGGDMRPAGIIRLARGQWSPRHVLYHFYDGTVIDETHEHRFYCVEQGFWQKLKNWNLGQHARRIDGTEVALEAVESIEERAEMFGLWVERGSYWANGLLSGDASANQALLADATAEQAAEMMASLEENAILQLLGVKEMLP